MGVQVYFRLPVIHIFCKRKTFADLCVFSCVSDLRCPCAPRAEYTDQVNISVLTLTPVLPFITASALKHGSSHTPPSSSTPACSFLLQPLPKILKHLGPSLLPHHSLTPLNLCWLSYQVVEGMLMLAVNCNRFKRQLGHPSSAGSSVRRLDLERVMVLWVWRLSCKVLWLVVFKSIKVLWPFSQDFYQNRIRLPSRVLRVEVVVGFY